MKHCTGCGLCVAICPKHCISLKENEYGSLKYQIDEQKCVHCGKCEKMCPQNSFQVNSVNKCYAGWAREKKERETSSSGGIAAVLYRKMLSMGGVIVGACYEDGRFQLKLADNETELDKFKGSKYVNCISQHIYEPVKQKINLGIPVLFIGTPCQVAAIKSYIGKSDILYTVDLICHGTPPQTLFEEHFNAHEKKIVSVNFRDGGIYKINMENAGGSRLIIDSGTDEYYLGFIRGVTFSDCCYNCQYAKAKRVSDITIGDFRGLDPEIHKDVGVERISVILSNTDLGEKLLSNTSEISLVERDLQEALSRNEQLKKPIQKSDDRELFEKLYPIYGFDKTIHKLKIEKIRRRNLILTKLSNLKNGVIKK